MYIISDIQEAKIILRGGGVIAYPTEAVFGLGCDPFNQTAVKKLWALKSRGAEKGFILLISDWAQLYPLIDTITEAQITTVRSTWPGFTTWIFPASPTLPQWITGGKPTIAIRMTTHPIAKSLCTEFPIISTSANLSGQPPIRDVEMIKLQFPQGVDALIDGPLGEFSQPSAIIDVQTGLKLR